MAKDTATKSSNHSSKIIKSVTTNIGIPDAHRSKVALILNTVLADEYVLYTKTKHFHWNVQGPHFHALHLLFDAQAEIIEGQIDATAERVRAIGHFAAGTLKQFLELTHLLETTHSVDGLDLVGELMQDHETVIREIRNVIDKVQNDHKDAGTADFLTGLVEQHETMAWMLRAHLA